MFRDLKEYQEIAKIYADKVSKPEDLEERVRGGGVSSNPVKPFEKPSPQVSGNRGNRPEVKGGITFKKPTPSASNKRAEMSNRRREMQNKPSNTDASGKVIPTTAQIRADAAAKRGGTPAIGGGNAGASTDSGGTSKSTIKSVEQKPEAKPLTKKQKFDAKFIKREKGAGVGFYKRGTPGAQRAEFQEKQKLKAQAMAKERIAAKKEGTASTPMSGKERAQAMAKARLAKKAEMAKEDYTPYDIVLEYLLSSKQAATIEEANYIMTEMDAKTIQDIVS